MVRRETPNFNIHHESLQFLYLPAHPGTYLSPHSLSVNGEQLL